MSEVTEDQWTTEKMNVDENLPRSEAERSLLSSFRDDVSYQGRSYVDDESDLEPPYHDNSRRKMSPTAAVFTLLASMLGGGMLTLPYATSKVGVIPSLVISLLSAAASECTYWFLVESSRATKKSSYQAIGEDMLGMFGRIIAMVSLILLTLFASMGYLLLLGLLVGELFAKDDTVPSRTEKNIIAIAFACLLAPLSSSQNLYALRFTNYFSVGAAAFLLLAVVYESSKDGSGFHPAMRRRNGEEILWMTSDWKNIIYAIPFYVGAYMAHFSMLSVHSELEQPSRERVRGILRKTVVTAWILYSAIGVIGYLYALDKTCDSIFSNLPRDWLTVMGRLGLVQTLAFSYPLFIVPCRATICDLVVRHFKETRIRNRRRSFGALETDDDADDDEEDEEITKLNEWLNSPWVRRGLTLIIVACSAFLACVIPSAALFVSLTGSSVGTILALILPSLMYLRLAQERRTRMMSIVAPVLLVLGILILVVCTWSSISHARDDPCDAQA